MIYSREKVRQAVARALALHPDADAAVAVVALALGLPEQEVRECLEQEGQEA